MEWIYHYGETVLRINSSKNIFENYSTLTNANQSHNNSVWIRKKPIQVFPKNIPTEWSETIQKNLLTEYETYWNNLCHILQHGNRRVLCPTSQDLNKLSILQLCENLKIPIPESILVSCKTDLLVFLNKHPQSIVKPLSNGFHIQQDRTVWTTYTTKITTHFLESLPAVFFPCLVQQEIEKQAEIRSFYLDGKFYSMCSFYPKNNTEIVDGRKYARQQKIRYVNYKLPSIFEKQLQTLMQEIGLNTGSFDIILCNNGEHCMLELNPFGQFDVLVRNCNYPLEKEIAKYLITKND